MIVTQRLPFKLIYPDSPSDKFGPLPTIRSMPKKINIDELAEMNQREFTGIRDEMRTGFEAVDHRLEELDHRFQAMDSRFDALTEILKAVTRGS